MVKTEIEKIQEKYNEISKSSHNLTTYDLRTIVEAYGQMEAIRQRLSFIDCVEDVNEEMKILAKKGLEAIKFYYEKAPTELLSMKTNCNPSLLEEQCLQILKSK